MITRYAAYASEYVVNEGETFEYARIFNNKEDAVAWISRMAENFYGNNNTLVLFELGRQIPIEKVTVEEPQPPKTSVVYRVKE